MNESSGKLEQLAIGIAHNKSLTYLDVSINYAPKGFLYFIPINNTLTELVFTPDQSVA